ncbi:hypothetical protein CSUI_006595 [Cystoisospora suis]|uniref:Uncharacterized protein n=1 Tax=Cystoisospora suis TaxID=483139 RepID=A0A2C6KTU8_9APIC|nr:hypothetical protein CSUI_006595 [Cystoisospora suis]
MTECIEKDLSIPSSLSTPFRTGSDLSGVARLYLTLIYLAPSFPGMFLVRCTSEGRKLLELKGVRSLACMCVSNLTKEVSDGLCQEEQLPTLRFHHSPSGFTNELAHVFL